VKNFSINILRLSFACLGGVAVWLAYEGQNYWAPLNISEKEWEPGLLRYKWAVVLYALFVILTIYFPVLINAIKPLRRFSWEPPRPGKRLNPWVATIVLAGILLLGGSMRLFGLEDLPPGLWLDEGINVMDAEEINRTGKHSIYLHSMSTQRTALFVESLTKTLDWGWPSRTYAVRGTAAVLGLVTVLLFFFLGQQMVSTGFGLLAAFLLTTSHWHVNYSRWGMEQILCPLFEIGALAFFFAAWRITKLLDVEANQPSASAGKVSQPKISLWKVILDGLAVFLLACCLIAGFGAFFIKDLLGFSDYTSLLAQLGLFFLATIPLAIIVALTWSALQTRGTVLFRIGIAFLIALFYFISGAFFGGGFYTYSNFRLFMVGIALFFLLLPFSWISQVVREWKLSLCALVLGGVSLAGLYEVASSAKESYEELAGINKLPMVGGQPEAFFPFLVNLSSWWLVIPVAGLALAYILLWKTARRDWFGFGILIATAAVTMAPFVEGSLSDWRAFTKRATETAVFQGKTPSAAELMGFAKRRAGLSTEKTGIPSWEYNLRDQSGRTLWGMHWLGDKNGRHNLPYAPQLAPIPAALSVLGLLFALMTLGRLTSRLLLIWVGFGFIPDMITWESPHASRMLDLLAPMLLLAGLAWRQVYISISRIPFIGTAVAVGLTLVGCFFVYKQDHHLYFEERPASKEFYESFLPDEAYAATFAGSLDESVALYVDPQLYSKHNFWFYQGGKSRPNPRSIGSFGVGSMPIESSGREDTWFVVMRTGEGLVGWLSDLYPRGEWIAGKSPWGRFNFAAVHVTDAEIKETHNKWRKGDIRLSQGLLARFYDGEELIETRQVPRLLDWNLLNSTKGRKPTRVTWDGFLWQEKSGPLHIGVHPQNITLTIDGQPWIRGQGARSGEGGQYVTRNLNRGMHRFHAEYDHSEGVRVPYFAWMYWRPQGIHEPGPRPFPRELLFPVQP